PMAHRGVVPTTMLAQRPQRDWDREIGAIATCQHGIVNHAQLPALGMRPSTIRARVARARLHGIHRGVYAVGLRPLRAHGYWMAAVLACGPDSALSFASAGGLQEIRPTAASLI